MTDKPEPSGRGELQSLVRGLKILDLFAELDTQECRLDDVLRHLEVPPATAYRLIRVLKAQGMLQDGSSRGSFRLGWRLGMLAERAPTADYLVSIAHPHLDALVEQTRETAFLTVRTGDFVLYADVVHSPEELRIFIRPRKKNHLYAGASAKVILAFLKKSEIDRLLTPPLVAYTPYSITDPAVIRADLARIREVGYAVSNNETSLGSAGIAVPIRRADGTIDAALTLSGPSVRMTDEMMKAGLAALRSAVGDIELRLRGNPG